MRLAARTSAIALLAVLVAAIASAPAAAHTGLDASDPADGATVDGPLELVVLDFTGTPTAIDDGIAVADATGATIVPAEVTQDGLRIVARFAPPLPAGSYALSWIVRSDDTHTIDGSFAFAVNVPTTTTVAPTTVPPTTAAPTSVAGAAPVVASTVAPTTSVPPAQAADAAEAESDRSVDVVVAPIPPASSVASEVDEGEAVARIGRLLLFPATVVAIGVLAFAAFAFAGRRDELGSLLRVVRWLGVAIALGALLEVVGLRSVFGGYVDLLDSGAGRAATARIAAGVLLVVGLGAVGAPARSLSAAVVDDIDARPSDQAASDRWRPDRTRCGRAGRGRVARRVVRLRRPHGE